MNYKSGDRSVLYCLADSVYFSSHSLLELADKFCINGGGVRGLSSMRFISIIKALISIICNAVPFELDAKKLAGAIEVSRDTVIEYLQDLNKADIFNLIYSEKKSIGKLTKPDKIYMETPTCCMRLHLQVWR